MKYTALLIALFLLSNCGKKTTMIGRIVNPVTNEGIPEIKVYVTRPKKSIGYDGAETKKVFETISDENGYFTIEKRFRRSISYTVSYGYDQKKYQFSDAQVSPAGEEYEGDYFEFPLIPFGYLKYKIDNQNCFDSNDNLTINRTYSLDLSFYGSTSSIYNGCYHYEFNGSIDGSPTGYVYAPIGWHKVIGTVTKNGITTPFADSIYVTEGGYHVWNIEY